MKGLNKQIKDPSINMTPITCTVGTDLTTLTIYLIVYLFCIQYILWYENVMLGVLFQYVAW